MIGLFLGEKKLPIEILKQLKNKKINHFIIDLTRNNKFKKNKNSYFINIGKFGKILDLIISNICPNFPILMKLQSLSFLNLLFLVKSKIKYLISFFFNFFIISIGNFFSPRNKPII